MKAQNIRINQQCHENWQNMKPNSDGRFCQSCAKNVVDFTGLTSQEISKKLKSLDGNICARITQSQLRVPLFEIDASNHYKLPYSKVAVGIMLAVSIASIQSCEVSPIQFESEIHLVESSHNLESDINQDDKNASHFSFTGQILDENKVPMHNVRVNFVTINQFYTGFTDRSGKFNIEIPKNLVAPENVVQISFEDFVFEDKERHWEYYETDDLILSGKQLYEDFVFTAKKDPILMGAMEVFGDDGEGPIAIYDGEEIPFDELEKAWFGENSRFDIENKDFFHFGSETAVVLYGEKAKHGLYLFF